jgi:hypothetical protein
MCDVCKVEDAQALDKDSSNRFFVAARAARNKALCS